MKLKTHPSFKLLLQSDGKDEMDLAVAALVMAQSRDYSKEDVTALMELEKEIRKTYSSIIDMEEEDKTISGIEKNQIKGEEQEDEDEDDFDYIDDTDYGYEEEKQDDSAIKDSSTILNGHVVQKSIIDDPFKKESIHMFDNIDDMDTFDDLLTKNVG